MPYTDRKRYPGLFRLRGGLRSRSRTEMPRPEARVPNRKVVPKIPPFATKAGLSINMPQSSKTGETLPGAEARKTLGWGGQKFAGNMTTDQFVTLAGGLAQAISPDTPQGRVGGVLSQFGQQEMLRRRGMAETLRKEGTEREKLHTTSLLDIGAEERKRKQGILTAETLAGTKTETARILAGAKVTAAETLAGTKTAEAGKVQARHEKKETGLRTRAEKKLAEDKRQFGIRETRLGKEKGEKGLTAYQKVQLGQDKLEYMQNWEKKNYPPVEPDYDSWFESTNEKKRKDYEQKLAAWERKREKVLKDYDTAIFGKSGRQGLAGNVKSRKGLSPEPKKVLKRKPNETIDEYLERAGNL